MVLSDIVYICFATMEFIVKDKYLPVESLALSQEGEPQTHSGKVRDVQHISDFSQQDYPEQSATQVHVGLLLAITCW